ncbi:MAG: hypothetical protein Q8M08_13655 [Bacteroidales bacterium]|nr:hypothetical protein [Bacteroidales bacterium]
MIESRLARAISYVFHPLLIPSCILALMMTLDNFQYRSLPFTYNLALFGVVFLTTVLFPLFLIWILYHLRMISSVFMVNKEERFYPIFAISVFYYLTYFILKGVHPATIFSYYMLGATLLAILSMMMNFYRKISLHMIGIGSFTGLFLGLSLNFGLNLHVEIFSGILASGIIGFARLKLNSHHQTEIYSGFVMGVVVMATLITLL